MTAKLKIGVLVVLVVASSAAFAASANTTASIERSASVDVVDDSNGLIALEAGASNDIVSQNSTGALGISFAQDDATGVNTASTFTVGDNNTDTYSSDTSTYAFNITNQDGQHHSVDLGYSLTETGQDTNENIQFNVYNGTGTSLTTASETTDGSIDLDGGQTAYVVLVVDTHGLSESNNLTGTLTIDV